MVKELTKTHMSKYVFYKRSEKLNRKVLIINYANMKNVGGIEKYLYRISKYMLNQNIRVIWLCDKRLQVAESFKDVMLGNKIERRTISYRFLKWFNYEKFVLKPNDDCVIVSFTLLDMSFAEKIVLDYSHNNIKALYVVPNTKGDRYFVEDLFGKKSNKKVKANMAKILDRWESYNAIRFFSPAHINALEKSYNICIKEPQKKVLKETMNTLDFDYNLLLKRSKRNKFTIITVGRFDFPHKGYMLGLVRTFGELKTKYPDMRLWIIGFGPGESILKKEINSLDSNIAEDISLLGEVSPDKLDKYMSNAHLNISVAGAVGDGARSCLLSIPARNFCPIENLCEVYGYLPESRLMGVSTEPGKDVKQYIEEVINMTNEEYIKKSINSYYSYKIDDADPLYIFHTAQEISPLKVDKNELFYLIILSYKVKFLKYIKIMKKRKLR